MRRLEGRHLNINNDNLTVIPICYCIAYRIYLRCYGLESMHVVFCFIFFFFFSFSFLSGVSQRITELSWDHILTGRLMSWHLARNYGFMDFGQFLLFMFLDTSLDSGGLTRGC